MAKPKNNNLTEEKIDILAFFHHIHHKNDNHEVHHCGGDHIKINPKLDYIINHCKCNKHKINVKEAIGHDFAGEELLFIFRENCPEGGWHIEGGKIKNDN